MIDSVRALICFNEGLALTARPDAKGKWEIGVGHDIPAPAPGEPVPTCTREEAYATLDNIDLPAAVAHAQADVGDAWDSLGPVRQAALTDMAFELGAHGLDEFQKMLDVLERGDWQTAHDEALNSEWAKQVPGRAERDALMLLTGNWPTG
jgi:GH24 family phage-related lysozyme (muramidase)